MSEAPIRRPPESRFVVAGCSRAQSAAEGEIRALGIAEYREQFEAAGPWGRFWLRRTINREVRFRLNKLAPPDALY